MLSTSTAGTQEWHERGVVRTLGEKRLVKVSVLRLLFTLWELSGGRVWRETLDFDFDSARVGKAGTVTIHKRCCACETIQTAKDSNIRQERCAYPGGEEAGEGERAEFSRHSPGSVGEVERGGRHPCQHQASGTRVTIGLRQHQCCTGRILNIAIQCI
jgi:hypothetical protein